MRDPKRIERMLNIIRTVWYTNPDFRLCQLIMNAVPVHGDPYYIEDDHLEKLLKEYYKNRGI